jgi:hypothetical protein
VKLGEALDKIGARLVKTHKDESSTSIWMRFEPRDALDTTRWRIVVQDLLDHASLEQQWAVDVSRHYHLGDDARVRYLWRMIFSKDAMQGLVALGKILTKASRTGTREFTSFPLVGRVEYEIDAANGKTKGVHMGDAAEKIVAMHARPGG